MKQEYKLLWVVTHYVDGYRQYLTDHNEWSVDINKARTWTKLPEEGKLTYLSQEGNLKHAKGSKFDMIYVYDDGTRKRDGG